MSSSAAVHTRDSLLLQLQTLKNQFEQRHLTDLFAQDAQRFEHFSVGLKSLVFDYSKQRIDAEVLAQLIHFAEAHDLSGWINTLFSSDTINYTEQRAAMHWALR